MSEQELRDSVRAFFAEQAPVRAQLADDPAVWKRLTTELGLTGLAVAEDKGGSGASF
jgi:alkylation response protein AidB-like acyl-CoA dehydrogenase